tara:strand:- start:248 stop:604 length:357 start_codon:yes stop_codon:yes gene_type:complete
MGKKNISPGQIFEKSKKFVGEKMTGAKKWYTGSVVPTGTKAGGKLARHYKRYVRPTTKIVRGVGRFARGTLKVAARFPGTGLAATGLYYAGKHIIKKGEKTVKRSAFKQYDKKGRWML